jgi:hypothetical protein
MAGRQSRELFRPHSEEGTLAHEDRTNALLLKGCEGRLEIAIGAGIHNNDLQAKHACCRLQVSNHGLGSWIRRVRENAKQGSIRHHVMEQLQLLRRQFAP